MSRFEKGRSGNPRGRPRKKPVEEPSAFDIVFDRNVTVNQDGSSRELSVEEALQLKTYQAAIAGSKPARREVLKMIAKREQWLAKRRKPTRTPVMKMEYESRSADAAMLILDIIAEDQSWSHEYRHHRYKLRNWAVEAAIARMRPKRMSQNDLDDAKRCTENPDAIRWPEVEL